MKWLSLLLLLALSSISSSYSLNGRPSIYKAEKKSVPSPMGQASRNRKAVKTDFHSHLYCSHSHSKDQHLNMSSTSVGFSLRPKPLLFDDPSGTFSVQRPSSDGETDAEQGLCDDDDLAKLEGSAFVQAVRTFDRSWSCMTKIWNTKKANRHKLFKNSNMVMVADEMRKYAQLYQGDNRDGLNQLLQFLRAGYYIQFYHPEDVGDYNEDLKRAIQSALDAFFSNNHFYTVSYGDHSAIMWEAITLVDSALEGLRYISKLSELLDLFDSDYQNTEEMDEVVSRVFLTYYRLSGYGYEPKDSYKQLLKKDPKVLERLVRFTERFDLVGSDEEYLLPMAVWSLGLHLAIEDVNVKAIVKKRLQQILKGYSFDGPYKKVWYWAANVIHSVFDNEDCETYGTDVCRLPEIVKREALPIRHYCHNSPHFIWTKNFSEDELKKICDTLAGEEEYFHPTSKTNYTPVADDYNSSLNMVIFDNWEDYGTYAGMLFNINTDNGGIYIEGDPANPDNQARFFAYKSEGRNSNLGVLNLKHEFVHYLDGRYNLYGGFLDSYGLNTTWWAEGLAEYISKRKENLRAMEEIVNGAYFPLSRIFSATYSDSAWLVYVWSYLAVRYLFENRPEEVEAILRYFRKGDYKNYYRSYIRGLAEREEQGFATWIRELKKRLSLYCFPKPSYKRYSYIERFGLGNQFIQSGSDGYSLQFFPDSFLSGTAYTLSVRVNTRTPVNNDEIRVIAWIDWNNDGNFDSGTELVMNKYIVISDSAIEISQVVNIPAGVKGVRRLRVKAAYDSNRSNPEAGASCGSFESGEVEDYDIEFVQKLPKPKDCPSNDPRTLCLAEKQYLATGEMDGLPRRRRLATRHGRADHFEYWVFPFLRPSKPRAFDQGARWLRH